MKHHKKSRPTSVSVANAAILRKVKNIMLVVGVGAISSGRYY